MNFPAPLNNFSGSGAYALLSILDISEQILISTKLTRIVVLHELTLAKNLHGRFSYVLYRRAQLR